MNEKRDSTDASVEVAPDEMCKYKQENPDFSLSTSHQLCIKQQHSERTVIGYYHRSLKAMKSVYESRLQLHCIEIKGRPRQKQYL